MTLFIINDMEDRRIMQELLRVFFVGIYWSLPHKTHPAPSSSPCFWTFIGLCSKDKEYLPCTRKRSTRQESSIQDMLMRAMRGSILPEREEKPVIMGKMLKEITWWNPSSFSFSLEQLFRAILSFTPFLSFFGSVMKRFHFFLLFLKTAQEAFFNSLTQPSVLWDRNYPLSPPVVWGLSPCKALTTIQLPLTCIAEILDGSWGQWCLLL